MLTLRRNVLIFHQAALGDFVLTWPIAMAAARLWPTNRTIYITHPSKGELAERAIGVEWRDGDPWHALFADVPTSQLKLPDAATKSLAGATLILSFVSNGNDAWARNVRTLAPEATLLCIQPRPLEEIDRHLTMFHAEQFDAKPELQAAIGQMIRHVAASGAVARRPAVNTILIHPGSGGADKCWPAERFVGLIGQLKEAGHKVHVILGEAEHDRWSPAVIAEFKRSADAIRTPATLIELFDLVATAKLYVGNDAGPTHLAALAGVPTLALFGRDNDATWRPLGPGARVAKHNPLNELPVEEVFAATQLMMAEATPAAAVADAEDE